MYIPKVNLVEEREDIISFMRRFNFATIITSKDNYPVATHLPFVINEVDQKIVLTSHFAKANSHWENIESTPVLVVFTEPHAYISTKYYEKETNVPTWNYMTIHVYGKGKIVPEQDKFDFLDDMIGVIDKLYLPQWKELSTDYKQKMANGIVVFEIEIDKIEAKYKLSQNRSHVEQENIIKSLSASKNTSENLIAYYMQKQNNKK